MYESIFKVREDAKFREDANREVVNFKYVTLSAKFRFKKEVAPIDIKDTKGRIQFNLENYLKSEEKLERVDNKIKYHLKSSDNSELRRIYDLHVKIKRLSLGFDLKAGALIRNVKNGGIPLDEIIDLEALNTFILKKNEEPSSGASGGGI